MHTITKTIISTILIILTAVLVYLGSIAAFSKGQLYIKAIKAPYNSESIHVEDITANFDKVIDHISPVGKKEVVKQYLAFADDLTKKSNLDGDGLLHFAEHAESKVIKDDPLQVILLAHLYNRVFSETGEEEYFRKAEEYMKRAHEIGPKLPHPLEGLAILYTQVGAADKLQEIAQKIIELWPNHPAVTTQQL